MRQKLTPQQRILGAKILSLPMKKGNDAGARNVREYLVAIVRAVWEECDGFSGKRPFGNSGWDFELAEAFAGDTAGLIDLVYDDDGEVNYDTRKLNKMVHLAISVLGDGEKKP